MTFLKFPDGFQWGAATASYQIEGAAFEGGKGLSIWDAFCRQPGKVRNGDTGDVACDHYHRYREDVALMKHIGLQTYRFSIGWPRVFPFGKGPVNEEGLAFYDRLVDELLAAGIEPCATLYHWDLPQALQDLGGWADRHTAYRFAEYADTMYRRLGDRVTRWITHNEPWVTSVMGHRIGVLAPGIRSAKATSRAIHHLHLSHGLAVQAFRASGRQGEIGLVNANSWFEPGDDTPEAMEAVELARDFETRTYHGPIYGKGYPGSVVKYYAERGAPFPIQAGDMEIIAAPTDFLGVNIYSRGRVLPDEDGTRYRLAPGGLPRADNGWELAPWCLGNFVRWVRDEYGNFPIYITENGMCDNTGPVDGVVDDVRRVEHVRGMLAGLHGAIQDGVDVRAYYLWSLLDNFEWAEGYRMRFGMVYVDFETQERIPKASARMMSEIIARNGFEH